MLKTFHPTPGQTRSWLKVKIRNYLANIDHGRVSAGGSSQFSLKILDRRLHDIAAEFKQRLKATR